MFQTDFIHFLQSFDYAWLKALMSFISFLGTTPVILVVVLGITFAIDFKRGLVLINVIAWTSLLTVLLKEQIDFPRPMDVDNELTTNYYEVGDQQLRSMEPSSFFEGFSKELLEITRNDEFERWGFPSGHTSLQMAFWMTLFFLFRKQWIKKMGIALVFLTILSRIYLGHHFLADTIGGLILGLIVVLGLTTLVRSSGYLTALSHQQKSLSILWLPATLIPFTGHLSVWVLSSLIGINLAALLIILQKNFPVFHVITWKRILAACIFLLLLISSIYWVKLANLFGNDFANLSASSLIIFAIALVATYLNNQLHLIRFRF
ncbi:MAG: hypothetical protein CMO34_00225 [Verrucomicrobia bacterium]|nr:hypothetical protein [Verrucomicrobiota bacterium]